MDFYRLSKQLIIFLGISFMLVTVAAEQSKMLASLDPSLKLNDTTRQTVQSALKHLNQRISKHPRDFEASLLKSMIKFKTGFPQQALHELDKLVQRAPDFHLAHLIRGDLMMAKLGKVSQIGAALSDEQLDKNAQLALQQLREEAKYRLGAHIQTDWHNRIPRQILALGNSVHNAIVVDKSSHRLYIFERQGDDKPPRLVRDYYVSTGKKRGDKLLKGDLRTPEGVYFVTSWIPAEKLPDKYGVGAFPVNYPNELDRHRGKTGYGIWLHGTESNYYSRPPLDSEGCVVLTNMDLNAIKKHIQPGITPVVITEQISWIDETVWNKQRRSLLSVIEQWRRDWESMDVERYLSHYSEDFWSSSHNYRSWSQRKRYLARNKSFQRVRLSDISLLAYPDSREQQDIIVVRMNQSYQSNNFNSHMQKRMYLSRVEDKWKIVYEGR